MTGNLHLVFAADPKRGTYLAEQAFCAPMHLSKTSWDGERLLVNVINQTAGVFGGDSIETRVRVGPGARVLLSSPSASRFHPSRGREARLRQVIEVAEGASLDVFPEISIPQRGSRSHQETRLEVAPGGELIYLEIFAPGRVASGEAFAFERYAWQTEIRVGDCLIHRERANLRGDDVSTAGLRALFPATYHASMILVSATAEAWTNDFLQEVAAAAGNATVRVAASRLTAHGWVFRILAGDSVALRGGIRELRRLVCRRLGRGVPDLRRSDGS